MKVSTKITKPYTLDFSLVIRDIKKYFSKSKANFLGRYIQVGNSARNFKIGKLINKEQPYQRILTVWFGIPKVRLTT